MRTNNRSTLTLTAAAVVLASGAAWSAALADNQQRRPDQPGSPAVHPDANTRRDAQRTAHHEFVFASDIIGADAVNANNETVAEVEDLIIDRGLGHVEYALIKSGAILGIGGKTIAVRFDRLNYDPVGDHFRLDMTKEQIDRTAEFVPENWRDLDRTTWEDDLDDLFNSGEEPRDYRTDGIPPHQLASGAEENLRGEIVSVRRDRSRYADEQTIVTLRTDDGMTRDVVLGPSWYVMGHQAAPMRGQKATLTVRSLDREGAPVYVATRADIEGNNLALRDDKLMPAWRIRGADTADRSTDAGRDNQARTYRQGSGRLMLVSDLVGADAHTLTDEKGEVQSVVIERNSGRVAFIGFDPNENILGLGDDIICVPFSIVSVRDDDTVVLDANTEMIKQKNQRMPDNLDKLEAQASLDSVYSSFGVQPDRFDRNDRWSDRSRTGDDRMGNTDPMHQHAWLKDANKGRKTDLSGRVISTQSMALTPGEPEVRVRSVQSADGAVSVILGPAWYLERQRLALDVNDTIAVKGRELAINGQRYIVANSIDRNGRTMNFWDGDKPAWAAR